MIRHICNVKLQHIVTIRSSELLAQVGIEDLDLILKERRFRWYKHVERSNGAVKTACDIQTQFDGKRGPGRPKMTWNQLTERDCREWKLSAIGSYDRHTWRSGVISAMRAASKIPRRGLTDVDVAPLTCTLIKKIGWWWLWWRVIQSWLYLYGPDRSPLTPSSDHYENKPIQIHWKYCNQKRKIYR